MTLSFPFLVVYLFCKSKGKEYLQLSCSLTTVSTRFGVVLAHERTECLCSE